MSLVSWGVSSNAFKTKEYIYKEENCKQISEDCRNISSITPFKFYNSPLIDNNQKLKNHQNL